MLQRQNGARVHSHYLYLIFARAHDWSTKSRCCPCVEKKDCTWESARQKKSAATRRTVAYVTKMECQSIVPTAMVVVAAVEDWRVLAGAFFSWKAYRRCTARRSRNNSDIAPSLRCWVYIECCDDGRDHLYQATISSAGGDGQWNELRLTRCPTRLDCSLNVHACEIRCCFRGRSTLVAARSWGELIQRMSLDE